MKWHQKHRGAIVRIISLLFILLFAYAGTTKLLEGRLFYENIRNSPVLGGKTIATLTSWIIPLSELAVALLFISGRTRLIGLYGAMALMLLFTAYTVAILFFAPYRPCSCGGVISLLSWNQHLVFNFAFLLMAFIGMLLAQRERKKH